MAIPEACGLWIEQRVQEELDQRGDTGASLREIGRQVAAEVERYFETKVKPMTITKKASRIESVTNVTPDQTTETIEENPNLKKLEKTQHGGPREGSGRKPKLFPKPKISEIKEHQKRNQMTDEFIQAYEQFFAQVQNAMLEKWSNTSKEAVMVCLERIYSLVSN